jgi:predicted oxidoreductase
MLNYPTPAAGLWRLNEWSLDARRLLEWTSQVLDLGISAFDLADIYGDYEVEPRFGEALALDPAIRERMFLITKCGIKLLSAKRPEHRIKHYDTGRAHITASVENSLLQMRTDRIDLLLIHRSDPLLDADETAEAFVTLKQSGKVLNFGVSNFTPAQFELLASRLQFSLITNQVEFSALHVDPIYDGTFDQCQRLRVSPMAWSPLAGGALLRGDGEAAGRVRSALQSVGSELGGLTPDQAALAWIVAHPARVVPVLGTGNLNNIRNAVVASTVEMTREQWFTVLAAAQGHEVP